MYKRQLFEMCEEAGVDVFFNAHVVGAEVEGGELKVVLAHTKRGTLRVEGSSFVDATGDADLAALAGALVAVGREGDGLVQPVTLMSKVANIDFARFARASVRLKHAWRI